MFTYVCLEASERTARKLFRDRGHGHTRVLGFLFLRNEEPNETITIKNGLYPYACFKRSISILFSILLPKSLPAVIGYIRCGIFCIDLSNLDLAEHEGSFFVPATHLLSFLLQYPSDVILPKYQCRH